MVLNHSLLHLLISATLVHWHNISALSAILIYLVQYWKLLPNLINYIPVMHKPRISFPLHNFNPYPFRELLNTDLGSASPVGFLCSCNLKKKEEEGGSWSLVFPSPAWWGVLQYPGQTEDGAVHPASTEGTFKLLRLAAETGDTELCAETKNTHTTSWIKTAHWWGKYHTGITCWVYFWWTAATVCRYFWLVVVCVQKAFFCDNCDVGEGGRRLHFVQPREVSATVRKRCDERDRDRESLKLKQT